MAKRTAPNLMGILFTRTLLSGALVFATYNPTPYSFMSYIGSQLGSQAIFENWALKLIAALVLGIAWWVFLRTAYHSLKAIALAIAAVLALGAYLLITKMDQYGYTVGQEAMVYVVLTIASLLLGIGATASHAKLRWAGVRNVEPIEND